MIPIGTDAPQRRMPLMNWAIIAACAIIYFASHKPDTFFHMPAVMLPGWGRFMLNPLRLHLYQFITYQFMHASILHIAGNMIFLWVFGNQVNERLGHIPYLLFFLAGGILAGCGQALSSNAPTLGASGSIAAVAGMFLVLAPLTNIRIWFFFFVFEVPSIFFLLFQIIVFDIYGVYTGGGNVAHYAHLTGYATGFIVGIVLLLTHLVQRDHYDLPALVNRWRRRHVYRQLVARGFDPFGKGGGGTPRGPVVMGIPIQPAAQPVPADPRLNELKDNILSLRREHRLAEAAQLYLELRQLAPMYCLPSDAQLDVSNQLMSEGLYAQAADGYEDYLKKYPTASGAAQVTLMLGIIYARYLVRPERAIELFNKAVERLHDPEQKAMAERELAILQTRGNSGEMPLNPGNPNSPDTPVPREEIP